MAYTIPKTKKESVGHPMWTVSKRCVLCDIRLTNYEGIINCNMPFFNHNNCRFIRACDNHRQEVIDNFSRPEFDPPFEPATIAFCQVCHQPFSIVSDDPTSFCSKYCRGNYLDRIP